MELLMRYFFYAFVLVFLILLFFNGCAFKDSSSLKCKTETTIKRTCDSEGTGQEIIISPAGSKAIRAE